jgi:hypothetical protein
VPHFVIVEAVFFHAVRDAGCRCRAFQKRRGIVDGLRRVSRAARDSQDGERHEGADHHSQIGHSQILLLGLM